MVDFYSMFYELQAMGFYDIILPFLLVFAIIFAILEKLKILGDKTNIHLLVALIMGLILISRPEITFMINNFIPNVSLFIIVVLMFLVIVGLFGASTEGFTGYPLLIAFIVSIIAVIWALFPYGISSLPAWIRPDPEDKAWIILIVTVIIAISFLKEKKENKDSALEGFIKGISKKP